MEGEVDGGREQRGVREEGTGKEMREGKLWSEC